MADARPPLRVMSNKSITAAATGDTDLVKARGARALFFIFTSSQASVSFAAASAFQLLVVPIEGMAETGLSVATPANFGIATPATVLNSAGTDDGVIVPVLPSTDAPCFGAYKIGARVTAGGSNLTDVDCDVVVVY